MIFSCLSIKMPHAQQRAGLQRQTLLHIRNHQHSDVNDNTIKKYILGMTESLTVNACVEDNWKVICDTLYN